MPDLEGKRTAPLQFPGLDNRSGKFLSPHIRVGASIYPNIMDTNPFVPKRGSGVRHIDWEASQTEASIIQFTWDKTMGQPSGSWTLVAKLKRGADTGNPLLDFDGQEIIDGDWIDLAIARNGIRIPLCRGLVDSVRKQTRSVGGATAEVYTMTGRDHGACFEYPVTWSSLWSRSINELASGVFTQRAGGEIGDRPDDMFRLLIKGTFQGGEAQSRNPAGQWIIPQSLAEIAQRGKLYDLLKIVAFAADKGGKHLRGAYYNEPELWTVGEQPLHQTLKQWVNPLLNEWWYDLIPPKAFLPKHGLAGFLGTESFKINEGGVGPLGAGNEVSISIPQEYESDNKSFGEIAAIIRERPFPTSTAKKDSMWFNLPTWTIPTWLLQSTDLGRSGHQRYNVFELLVDFGMGSQQEQSAFGAPRWDKDSIATHGLRVFPGGNTRFTAVDRGGPAAWFAERELWIKQLVDWYAPNPYLLQGRVVAKIPLPEVRVGHRVILDNGDPKQQIQAYVEGVQINITSPQQGAGVTGSTTLMLTRGFQGTDDELMKATIDLAKLYQGVF